jgi:VWFA-related protein
MEMRTLRLFLLPVLCLSVVPALVRPGSAQQSPAPNRQITLDVVVTDKSGKPVSGLEQKDFTLLDNKQPQKILSFQAVNGSASAPDPPVEVILLSDEVNTGFTNVSVERGQIEKFLQHEGGELPRPVSIAFLSDSGIKIGDVTTQDGKALVAELDRNKAGLRSITRDQGYYGAADRVGLSLHALEELAAFETPRPGRKLVIWLSPGWPFLTGPRELLSSKQQLEIFQQIVRISGELRSARITLYSIDPLGANDAGSSRLFYYQEFVKGVKKPGQVQVADLALQAIATQTGGRVLNSSNDVAGEIATCLADANTFYVLTFEGLPGDGPDEYHALEIKLDRPGLKALTRTGYYAQPAR